MFRMNPSAPAEKTAFPAAAVCRHCGADLLGIGSSAAAQAGFCCEGCRIVYGLLADREDGRYYELLRLEKNRAPRGGLSREYREFLEALKNPEALKLLGHWQGDVHRLTLACDDMQCAACGWLMERELAGREGVLDYQVDFIHGEIDLCYDARRTALAAVLVDIGRFGYAFRPRAVAAARPQLNRDAWMRLAVAGACFANAMALAAGPYFGLKVGIEDEWRRMLGLWAFVSALPAVLYSAFPFYRGAWRAVRSRSFTIDVTVSIGILLTFGVSLVAVWGGGSANYADSLAGLVFFLLLGRLAVRRFEGGLLLRGRWYEALRPEAVRALRQGEFTLTPLDQVVAGDTVEIAAGAYLPVDGPALHSGMVDTALLTGEDRPRAVAAGDFLFAGYRVLGKSLRLRVANPHLNTRAEGLRRALESLAERKQRRVLRRDRVALAFTTTVILAAALTVFLHRQQGWERAFSMAGAVFIVSCSCALALSVPVSRGLGLLRAHRLGFHFRAQETLERLRDIQGVLFDKTGTLTFSRRRVTRWQWVPGAAGEIRASILGGLKCMTGMSFHPVSAAVHAGLEEGSAEVTGFSEWPHFGVQATLAAAPFTRLCLCRYGAWVEPNGAFAALQLCVPSAAELPAGPPPQACLFVDRRLAACIWLSEEIKPGVAELLAGLSRLGIRTLLLSGDHPERVEAFARRCGFPEFRGGLSPEEKQVEARKFQRQYGAALAVGDGFNDSLLFGEAELALAVQGAAGSMAENADVFMTGQNPESLLSLFRIARGVRRSLRNSYIVSGIYNSAAITLAVAGFVSPLLAAILMPFASLSICATAWLSVPRR